MDERLAEEVTYRAIPTASHWTQLAFLRQGLPALLSVLYMSTPILAGLEKAWLKTAMHTLKESDDPRGAPEKGYSVIPFLHFKFSYHYSLQYFFWLCRYIGFFSPL